VLVLTNQVVIAFVKGNGMMELGLVTQGIAIAITFVGGSLGEVHLKGVVKLLLAPAVKSVVILVAIASVLNIIKV
jgi:hypothetical protein